MASVMAVPVRWLPRSSSGSALKNEKALPADVPEGLRSSSTWCASGYILSSAMYSVTRNMTAQPGFPLGRAAVWDAKVRVPAANIA
jgi:hypothetical protein